MCYPATVYNPKYARTVKVVLVPRTNTKRYAQWFFRVVECAENQQGYLSEPGIKVIHQSEPLYRPLSANKDSRGAMALKKARKIAHKYLRKVLGV